MQVVRLEVNECMPGMNTYPKVTFETPIVETPTGIGETPCNDTMPMELYSHMSFRFFNTDVEELMDKIAPFNYTEIKHPEAYGAEVEMYVQPELNKLLEWAVEHRTQQLEHRILLEQMDYNSKCVEVKQLQSTLNQMKWWLCGMSALTMSTVGALTYVVTFLI